MKSVSALLKIIADRWKMIGWFIIVLVNYLSLIPSPPHIDPTEGGMGDHVLAYTVMMWWWGQLYTKPKNLWVALAFVIMGVALEFAQRMTGYRTFDYMDMVGNACGVALGLVVSAKWKIPALQRLYAI